MTITIEEITHRAQLRHVRDRLDRIDEMRDAARLEDAGKTQREIADILHTTQPRVHRMLRGARTLGTTETPEEIILRAAATDSSREELVRTLSSLDYTFAEYAPHPHEGSLPGTWTQVGAAHVSGLLSDEEYQRVSAAVRPPTP